MSDSFDVEIIQIVVYIYVLKNIFTLESRSWLKLSMHF